MSEPLLEAVEHGIRRWTLNRPEHRNALDDALGEALLAAAERARRDRACRAVLLGGTPPVFCAGSDVAFLASKSADEIVALETRWSAFSEAFRAIDAPVVAKVHGGAWGGGLFLLVFADYRLAEERAVFAAPEVPLGWLPPGGIEELAAEIGVGSARHLVLTGARVRAQRALELGLVHEVVPAERLDRAADAAVERLATLPRSAVASVKRYFRERGGLAERQRDELQLQAFAQDLRTDAAQASIRRFAQRMR